jgi:hypothetical protein
MVRCGTVIVAPNALLSLEDKRAALERRLTHALWWLPAAQSPLLDVFNRLCALGWHVHIMLTWLLMCQRGPASRWGCRDLTMESNS